jgi:hypothetical protein
VAEGLGARAWGLGMGSDIVAYTAEFAWRSAHDSRLSTLFVNHEEREEAERE